ncbi:MAG: TIGR03943 family protein [Phototrophicales bacterium]|nr:MAG: TIGR03943 family protein [Phototrophicales bacterium]RMG72088.1 MAG: TIGR03943 family protein [Chloroflexota bacterium]
MRQLEWTKAAVLLGLAGYFVFNIATGDLNNYINTRFAWLSYVAVGLFGLLGIMTIYALLRHHESDMGMLYQDDMTHTRIGLGVVMIVAIPLVIGTLIPSRPLGAEAVNGNISLTASTYAGVTVTKDPLERNVLDWLRVFAQEPAPAVFNGERADVIGFIYREPDFPPDHFMVARFTVSCCVADAGAIGLPVYAPSGADLADGEWVRVTGVFEAGTFRNTKMPILHADTLEVVPEPDHPYLYP